MTFSRRIRTAPVQFDPVRDTELYYEDIITLMDSTTFDLDLFFAVEEEFFRPGMAFAIEQSCDKHGRLRPRMARRSWLQQFSRQLAWDAERLLDRLPRGDRKRIAWMICWAVRIGRGRTTESATPLSAHP